MGSVVAEHLGKCFKHYERSTDRLWDWATLGRRPRFEPRWVLREVGFELRPGEGLGVTGANGAGKSTLLKLVRGTLRPSEGSVRCVGRMASLELGLGFHPDFTGRQNLTMSGALLGLDAAAIRSRIPEILDFAEIGPVLDEPIRTYSSGMAVRLAFSLATTVRPDLLLVDEALAVGDAYFQQKCIARLRQYRESGMSLILVSHDPGAIRSLCDRAILLDRGLMVRAGMPDEVLDYYNAVVAKQTADYAIREGESLGRQAPGLRSGDGSAVIESVEMSAEGGPSRAYRVGEPVTLQVNGRASRPIEALTVGVSIRDRLGNEVFGTNTHHLGITCPGLQAGEGFRAEFRLPLALGCGHYTLTTAVHAGAAHLEGSYDWWDKVCVFQVLPGAEPPFVGCAHLPTTARLETRS